MADHTLPTHVETIWETHRVHIDSHQHTDLVVGLDANGGSTFPTTLSDPHATAAAQYIIPLPRAYTNVTKITLTQVRLPYQPRIRLILDRPASTLFETPRLGDIVQYVKATVVLHVGVVTHIVQDSGHNVSVLILRQVSGDWTTVNGEYTTTYLQIGHLNLRPNYSASYNVFHGSIAIEMPYVKLQLRFPDVPIVRQGLGPGVYFTKCSIAPTWQAYTEYNVADVVRVGAQLYRCVLAHAATNVFVADLAIPWWAASVGPLPLPPSIPHDQCCALVLDYGSNELQYKLNHEICWHGAVDMVLPQPHTVQSIALQWLNEDNTLYEPPWIDYGSRDGATVVPRDALYRSHSLDLTIETASPVTHHARHATRARPE